ncbi:MAG: DUF5406 family protein [Pseudohongiella sp.]|nr:DUF5406 family protein [Pseudohongiella sp.]
MNYDPNLTLCGRMATQTVDLTFQLWQYKYSTRATVGGNCTGMDVIDAAIGFAFDHIIGGDDYAAITMVDDSGKLCECVDTDGREVDWLREMLVKAEIVDIQPKEKKV